MRRLVIGLATLLVAALGVTADEAVLQVLIGSPPNARLEEILYLASGVELNRAGLTSRRMSTSPQGDSDAANRRMIEAEARAGQTSYVLLVQYAPGDTTIAVDFTLYESFGEAPVATAELQSPIDIDLDRRVADEVRDLLAEAGVRGERTSATTVEGIGLASSAGPAPGSAVALTPVSGLEFGVMTSGLLVVGAATEYFRYGVAGTLSGTYAPSFSGVGASFGARSSVIRVFSDEGVEGGALYVITAGPEAFVGSRYRGPTRIGARASAGAAVLMVSREAETIAKTVPYVDAGVAARLPLGALFSIGLEVNYLVVLERGFPLMGFSPSITVSMEP